MAFWVDEMQLKTLVSFSCFLMILRNFGKPSNEMFINLRLLACIHFPNMRSSVLPVSQHHPKTQTPSPCSHSSLFNLTRSIGIRAKTRCYPSQPLRRPPKLLLRLPVPPLNQLLQQTAFLGVSRLLRLLEFVEIGFAFFGAHGGEFFVEGVADG